MTRNHQLAEDVTQDAMLKAWQALPTYRGDAPLRNWVLRSTHNTAISALRKRRDVLQDPFEMPEEPASRTVERQAHGRMALDASEEALGQLDELTRSIVVLREIESLSYDEIAELLDVSLPTVKPDCSALDANSPQRSKGGGHETPRLAPLETTTVTLARG